VHLSPREVIHATSWASHASKYFCPRNCSRAAADLLEIPFHAPESSEVLEVRHDPFWVTRARPEVLGAIAPGLFDRFLPEATRQVRLRRRLVEEIEAALLRNVENLRWATRQNIADTFRRFGEGAG
jgi:hypothetical protein